MGHGNTQGQDVKIYSTLSQYAKYAKGEMPKIVLTLSQDDENYFNPKPIC
jgi:hypothetical protein